MRTLYELSSEYADLLDFYDDAETDEQIEECIAQLQALEGDITAKADAYARIMRSKQAEAAALKAEIDRLAKKKKAAENLAERLKAAMLDGMDMMQIKAISTTIGKWTACDNPPSCIVISAQDVPEEWHIKQEDKIDRTGILKHYKSTGELLPGVEITSSRGIRFR